MSNQSAGREEERTAPVDRSQFFEDVPDSETEKVYVWPNLLRIEMIAALVFTAGLILLAVFVNAPLRDLANEEVTPNPSKAPWYFLGLQELLLHMHPSLAGVIVPTVVLIGSTIMEIYEPTVKLGILLWLFWMRITERGILPAPPSPNSGA